MAKRTIEELYEILHKPKSECNGFEIHLQYCWEKNKSKSIFYLTGLDVSGMLGQEKDEIISSPRPRIIIIPPK